MAQIKHLLNVGMSGALRVLASALFLGACSPQGDVTSQGNSAMSCKLQEDKIVQGRSRQCLYVCADRSIEGRTRGLEQSCPTYISSQKPRL